MGERTVTLDQIEGNEASSMWKKNNAQLGSSSRNVCMVLMICRVLFY